MVSTIVTNLIQELNDRAQQNDLRLYEEILGQKLRGLGNKERMLLEKFMYKHEWNIGSASVIRLLSELDLFNISIYLCKLNPDEQQNIFNDLLETEHYLLGVLIKNSFLDSPMGPQLQKILSKGIANLLSDLMNRPLLVPNYIHVLQEKYLQDSEMQKFQNLHINILLELDCCPSITEALQRQFLWNEENIFKRSDSLKEIISELIRDSEYMFTWLFSRMLEPSFTHWRFSLSLLQLIIVGKPELKSVLKKHLSELFTEWIAKRNDRLFYVLMLLGRQLAYSSDKESKVVTYLQWYKYQIADMNYKLKSKEQFIYGMSCLSKLVAHESDLDFVQVHIKIAIPAPPYCKVYVTDFKEASKRKETELISPNNEDIPTNCDDDDDMIIVIN